MIIYDRHTYTVKLGTHVQEIIDNYGARDSET